MLQSRISHCTQRSRTTAIRRGCSAGQSPRFAANFVHSMSGRRAGDLALRDFPTWVFSSRESARVASPLRRQPDRRRSRGRSHRPGTWISTNFARARSALSRSNGAARTLACACAVFHHAIPRLLQIVQSFAHEWARLAVGVRARPLPGNRRPTLRHGKPRSCEIKSGLAPIAP